MSETSSLPKVKMTKKADKTESDTFTANIEEPLETILGMFNMGNIWVRISIPNAATPDTANLPAKQRIYLPNKDLPYRVTFGQKKEQLFNVSISEFLSLAKFIKEHKTELNQALQDEKIKVFTSEF